MVDRLSSVFFLECIERTLSHVYIQDQFPQLKLFAEKKYRLILLYEIMKNYYLNTSGTSNIDFLPTKESLYQLVVSSVSRLSMTKFIDRMVDTKVLIKKNHSQDKRKQLLSPSSRLVEEFELMHQQREQALQKNIQPSLEMNN